MHSFHMIDVFTGRLARGNALAVVHDAEGLSDTDLAAFANWTNLSETTFLLPPTSADADYRVRIFTTSRELPFAGHPTLGSARAWLEAGGVPKNPGVVVQECGVGLVSVRYSAEMMAFAAPALLRYGPVDPSEAERVIACLDLKPAQVVASQWVDNGPGWMALLVDSAQSVLDIEYQPERFAAGDEIGVIGPCPEGSEVDFEVRAFTSGGVEDPVTGSLNASIGQWLTATSLAPQAYTVSQGTRLGRQGRVRIESLDGQVWVGGHTVVGVTGTLHW